MHRRATSVSARRPSAGGSNQPGRVEVVDADVVVDPHRTERHRASPRRGTSCCNEVASHFAPIAQKMRGSGRGYGEVVRSRPLRRSRRRMFAGRLRKRGRQLHAEGSARTMHVAAEEDAAVENSRQQHDDADEHHGQPQLRDFPPSGGSATHACHIIANVRAEPNHTSARRRRFATDIAAEARAGKLPERAPNQSSSTGSRRCDSNATPTAEHFSAATIMNA